MSDGVYPSCDLGVSSGKVEAETEWLTEVLGCTKIEGPPNAHWFVFDDGAQIHLSEDEFHKAAVRMHVAVQFDDVARIKNPRTPAGGDQDGGTERSSVCLLRKSVRQQVGASLPSCQRASRRACRLKPSGLAIASAGCAKNNE